MSKPDPLLALVKKHDWPEIPAPRGLETELERLIDDLAAHPAGAFGRPGGWEHSVRILVTWFDQHYVRKENG